MYYFYNGNTIKTIYLCRANDVRHFFPYWIIIFPLNLCVSNECGRNERRRHQERYDYYKNIDGSSASIRHLSPFSTDLVSPKMTSKKEKLKKKSGKINFKILHVRKATCQWQNDFSLPKNPNLHGFRFFRALSNWTNIFFPHSIDFNSPKITS